MAKNLYVSNLSYGVDTQQLQEIFEAYGEIQSAKVIMDRDTGRSRGFGFVEMSSPAEAEAAIAGMHGKNVGGRDLTVNIARPMEARAPRSGGFGGGGNFGGGGGGFNPANPAGPKDNPMAGIRRDPSNFSDSKLYIQPGVQPGFQTRPSKANDVNWDEDDMPGGNPGGFRKAPPPDEDVPF